MRARLEAVDARFDQAHQTMAASVQVLLTGIRSRNGEQADDRNGPLSVTLIQPKTLLALLWMAVPARLLLTALWAVVRRARLHREPLAVTGTITEVETNVDGALALLKLEYRIDGRDYTHATTRTDNLRAGYSVGATIDLVCRSGDPGNVMDAAQRPWDDVIGPVVLAVLLAFFMAWAWQVLVGF